VLAKDEGGAAAVACGLVQEAALQRECGVEVNGPEQVDL
jgi:hypothetical protein